jgi:redox-sensitive bicupin YhaK (pirin superfamily)
MSVKIVAGEISAKDATTRTVVPTAGGSKLPPFERVAETIATPRRRFPPHRHEGVEVLTYVIEGSGLQEYGSDAPVSVRAGSTSLLSATASVAHSMNPGIGQTMRWFAILSTLPSGRGGSNRVQSGLVEPSAVLSDGTVVRRLVGPGALTTSAMGLECEEIEFRSTGAAFRRVGRDRVGIFYAITGTGQVDGAPLDAGEAALAEDVSGVGIQGRSGLHLMFASAPRSK